MLELSLLRHPRFVGVLLLPVATCCCYVVLLIIVPLHFMGGEGMSESQSALYLMALTTPMLVFPSVAALLTRWFSPGQVSTAGLMMASAGLLLLGDAFHSNHLPQLVLALILCGAGAALPWGLMDGLAISAVPVAKAGMAAGLFNTVRVAGEGIALAVVSAVLTASNTLTLQSRVHGYAPEVIHRAAGWLGAGNMPQAAALLPDFSLRALRESYDSAYTLLFSGLAVVTLLCALMIWLTLCRKGALSKPATADPDPHDSALASRSRQPPFPVCSANRDCHCFADGTMLIRAAICAAPAAETVTHRRRYGE